MNRLIFLTILGCALVAGCAKVRPISNSGYTQPRGWPNGYEQPTDGAYAYRGELSEFDVLGVSDDELTTENDIRRALDNSKRFRLPAGSSILLIQSGAVIPDGFMVTELSKHFSVVPFSGVPACPGRMAKGADPDPFMAQSYGKSLRLAAARGGNQAIVCYWGMLESESDYLPTKTVSWVPVVNWILPDEKQHMRIRLKIALIDVRTGNWTVFSPKPFEDARISTSPRRGTVDQKQVERLKGEAYTASARELVRLYCAIASAGSEEPVMADSVSTRR